MLSDSPGLSPCKEKINFNLEVMCWLCAGTQDEEDWNLISAWSRKSRKMKSENDQDTAEDNCTNLIQPSTNTTSRMQRVLVLIDSLLKGTEASQIWTISLIRFAACCRHAFAILRAYCAW